MMKRITFTIIGLLILFVLTYLYAAQNVELIFSHKYHAKEVEAACTDCHAADQSGLATDNLLPDMEKCYTCHDSEQECSTCHKDPDNAVVYPRITNYIAKFPHDKHISQNIECEKCHTGVAVSENIMDTHLPSMDICVECHTGLEKDEYCNTCHAKGEDLKPEDHKLGWRAQHGIVSSGGENSCQSCHSNESCLECHQKENLDHKVHRLNYENNHGLYARGNKENCYTCHEEQAFCVNCHQQKMVMPRNHATANWSNKTTGGRHARAAKLDMDSCLSCHSDTQGDPVCVICHKL